MTSWADLDPEIRAVAEEVCTGKQLDALKLWNAGWGYRRIGLHLGMTAESARGRLDRAKQRIAKRKAELDEEREAA